MDCIVVANRTPERAEALAQAVPKTRAAPWSALRDEFGAADLIINATTLGMAGAGVGAGAAPDWPVDACKREAIIADMVYRPLETPLLLAARRQGLVAIDGLGMLIHQGVRSFEIWFGIKPDPAAARARLMAALGESPGEAP
jgi:shikimate dehydrogenase